MKIKCGYTLTNNGDTYTLCQNSKAIKRLHISHIGAFLMEKTADANLTNAQMLELLLDNFEISTVLALGEIDTFIKLMKENGLVEE